MDPPSSKDALSRIWAASSGAFPLPISGMRCDSSFSTLVSQVLPASIRDRALQAAPVSGQALSDQCAARSPGGIIGLFIFVDTTLGLRGFRYPQQRKTATHSTREFV